MKEINDVKVSLIECPDNLIELLWKSCKVCYSSESVMEIKKPSVEKMITLIKKVIGSGHTVSDHIYFMFHVSGIDRRTSHQIVRHRHMSFSQRSQRYCSEGDFDFTIPDSIRNDSIFLDMYNEYMSKAQELYKTFVKYDIPKEDARLILPNACKTELITSLNITELRHFCNKRLCKRAQGQAQEVARQMSALVVEKHQWMKDFFVPSCFRYGGCFEHKSCGYYEREVNKC